MVPLHKPLMMIAIAVVGQEKGVTSVTVRLQDYKCYTLHGRIPRSAIIF